MSDFLQSICQLLTVSKLPKSLDQQHEESGSLLSENIDDLLDLTCISVSCRVLVLVC